MMGLCWSILSWVLASHQRCNDICTVDLRCEARTVDSLVDLVEAAVEYANKNPLASVSHASAMICVVVSSDVGCLCTLG